MGAAFNAMMEEESKEWIVNRCCELMDEVVALKEAHKFLDKGFLTLMNDIGRYGQEKYGADSFHSRAQTGDRSRSLKRTQKEEILRHVREHTAAYARGELHDKFGDLNHQLAAAAFNCLMEYYFSKFEQS